MRFDSLRARGVLAALGCLALASTALAETALARTSSGPVRDLSILARGNAQLQASAGAARAAKGASTAAPAGGANDIYANPYRAYPPSCLSEGLVNYPFDAVRGAQQNITLYGDPLACIGAPNGAECTHTESATFKAWRVACSGGKSAVLLEIDRPANLEGNGSLYPVLPLIYVTQGSNSIYIRYADDPNTFYTTTYAYQPLVYSDVFVLENFYGGATQIDYNQAFTLYIDTGANGNNTPPNFAFPAYNKANYPNGNGPLPISGYMTSNWFDPAHGGEGILTEVFDNADGTTRTFTAAWYTFDDLGIPYWLFAQGNIAIGATSTGTVNTYYAGNGCFAGAGCGSASFTLWGTASFSFPDCGHMAFTYNGTAGTNGPSGAGQKTWTRVANVNSLVCE